MKFSKKSLASFLSHIRKSLDNLCGIIEKEFSLIEYTFQIENSTRNLDNYESEVFCGVLGDRPNKNHALGKFREFYNQYFNETLKKYDRCGINADIHIKGWVDKIKKYIGDVKIAEPKTELDKFFDDELHKLCEKPEQD